MITKKRVTRRSFIEKVFKGFIAFLALGNGNYLSRGLFAQKNSSGIPLRKLGRTGQEVTAFGLGGEGVLRTFGKMKEAVRVIRKALELGVTYFDTAPAYSQSQDYLGEALGDKRKNIFLASKTHDRTRDGSLKLLDSNLKRLKTDYLNLWQIHDVRSEQDIRQIFGKGGAIEAAIKAREEGMVRYIGITGHYHPQILKKAIEMFDFDTIMMPVNPADRHYNSFIEQLLPVVIEKNMGIIGMKVYGRGMLFTKGGLETPKQALDYALSFPVSTAIIGCRTPGEVEENARIAREFVQLTPEEMKYLESLTEENAYYGNFFKG